MTDQERAQAIEANANRRMALALGQAMMQLAVAQAVADVATQEVAEAKLSEPDA